MRYVSHAWIGLALLFLSNARAEDVEKPSAVDADFFESKVRPVLADRCFGCHGVDKQKGGLRLDSPKAMRTGGDSGPAVVAGKIDESLLVEAIRYSNEIQMPPKGKLPEAEIATLTDWVKRGAPWPEVGAPSAASSVAANSSARPITEADRAFWSFQPVKDFPAPSVSRTDWAQGDLDRFILAKLESEGLAPSSQADKRTLIRRASFDLIGLPPTPQEVEVFLRDESSESYSKVIDRLLASPHYGERWGRHWLDIARYGEDQAHSFQPRLYPNGFRYRDWLINALNHDMPYDRFVVEQIAGDLLDEPDKATRLPALGFFALGPVYYGDPKKFDQLDDRIDTLSRGFLGLTVACARCHDHKFDPIPTADYYSLAGVFASSEYHEEPLGTPEEVEAYRQAQADLKAKTAAVDSFVKIEGKKVVESRADTINAYVVAAWMARADSAETISELAKARMLELALLRRWIEALNPAGTNAGKRPQLAGWLKRLGGSDSQIVADELQNWVKALMARRTSTHEDKLNAREVLFLDELVGDGGLLALPKEAIEGALAPALKTKLNSLRKELNTLKKSAPEMYPVVHTLKDASQPADISILLRGNTETPGAVVARHFLSILGGEQTSFRQGSGRLELAKSIASAANPLTARVMVNRVWQWHFGRGLVATPSNFGLLGERPSHPELLDHLTSRFTSEGWSLKTLHRTIMLSATYQQANESNRKAEQSDPENRLLWRMNRRRLEVESWRDAMLAVSGRLDEAIGGPSLNLESAENRRRTVYAKISRHDLAPLLRGFDFPDPNISSAERTKTTVPLQGLTLLNSEFLVANAKALVLRFESEQEDEARIRRVHELLFARPVRSDELRIALDFLRLEDPTDVAKPDLSRWQRYAQALLSTNEFAFVD